MSVHCSVLRFMLMPCNMLHKCTQCGDLLVTFKNVLIYCSGLQMYVIISRRFRKSVSDKYACAVHTTHLFIYVVLVVTVSTQSLFSNCFASQILQTAMDFIFSLHSFEPHTYCPTKKATWHGIFIHSSGVHTHAVAGLFSWVFFSKACMHVQRNDYHFHLGVFVAPRTRFGRFVRSFGGGVHVAFLPPSSPPPSSYSALLYVFLRHLLGGAFFTSHTFQSSQKKNSVWWQYSRK